MVSMQIYLKGFYKEQFNLKFRAFWADNTLRDLQNSSYPTKTEFINSFIILSNISPFLKEFCHFALKKKNTTSSPGFLGQRFNCLQRAALLPSFWRHWFNMTKLLTSLAQQFKVLSKFGQRQLVMVNYACGFNQSETGNYFEWVIIYDIPLESVHNKYVSHNLIRWVGGLVLWKTLNFNVHSVLCKL